MIIIISRKIIRDLLLTVNFIEICSPTKSGFMKPRLHLLRPCHPAHSTLRTVIYCTCTEIQWFQDIFPPRNFEFFSHFRSIGEISFPWWRFAAFFCRYPLGPKYRGEQKSCPPPLGILIFLSVFAHLCSIGEISLSSEALCRLFFIATPWDPLGPKNMVF